MVKSSSSQNGSAFIVVIIILAVAIVSVLGFVFWQNFNHGSYGTTNQNSTKVDEKSESDEPAQELAYTLQNAIDDIYKVISTKGCGGNGTADAILSFEQVPDQGEFKYAGGKSFINKGLSHAYVQYGCGSQGVVALLMKDKDSWTLLNEDARTYPMCAVVLGKKFPSSVVDKCYENDSSTEPVNI
jgi:hypothetical protein